MVKVRKYIYSWTYVPQLGGGGEWEPLYITKKTSYKMKEKAQFPVIKAFSRNNIGLHIDDGCMGGGKGNIPYSKKLFDNIQGIPNFIQYKHNTGFFNTNRVGIFHYLISCEYMYHIHCTSGDHMLVETDGKAERGFTDKNGIPRKGGDWMMIAVPYAVDNYGSKFVNNQYVASLFMHELGHNIGLFEDDPNWGCMKGAFTKKVDYEEGWKVINPSVIQYCRNEET